MPEENPPEQTVVAQAGPKTPKILIFVLGFLIFLVAAELGLLFSGLGKTKEAAPARFSFPVSEEEFADGFEFKNVAGSGLLGFRLAGQTPVFAAAEGTISVRRAKVGEESVFDLVRLNLEGGGELIYLFNSAGVAVKDGDKVGQGQEIASAKNEAGLPFVVSLGPPAVPHLLVVLKEGGQFQDIKLTDFSQFGGELPAAPRSLAAEPLGITSEEISELIGGRQPRQYLAPVEKSQFAAEVSEFTIGSTPFLGLNLAAGTTISAPVAGLLQVTVETTQKPTQTTIFILEKNGGSILLRFTGSDVLVADGQEVVAGAPLARLGAAKVSFISDAGDYFNLHLGATDSAGQYYSLNPEDFLK